LKLIDKDMIALMLLNFVSLLAVVQAQQDDLMGQSTRGGFSGQMGLGAMELRVFNYLNLFSSERIPSIEEVAEYVDDNSVLHLPKIIGRDAHGLAGWMEKLTGCRLSLSERSMDAVQIVAKDNAKGTIIVSARLSGTFERSKKSFENVEGRCVLHWNVWSNKIISHYVVFPDQASRKELVSAYALPAEELLARLVLDFYREETHYLESPFTSTWISDDFVLTLPESPMHQQALWTKLELFASEPIGFHFGDESSKGQTTGDEEKVNEEEDDEGLSPPKICPRENNITREIIFADQETVLVQVDVVSYHLENGKTIKDLTIWQKFIFDLEESKLVAQTVTMSRALMPWEVLPRPKIATNDLEESVGQRELLAVIVTPRRRPYYPPPVVVAPVPYAGGVRGVARRTGRRTARRVGRRG
jgi:hypothetical protein